MHTHTRTRTQIETENSGVTETKIPLLSAPPPSSMASLPVEEVVKSEGQEGKEEDKQVEAKKESERLLLLFIFRM